MEQTREALLRFGMTEAEVDLWYDLARFAGGMLALPEQHQMERAEVCTEIHVLQNRLLARPGMRAQASAMEPRGPEDL